jgi:hypothetical protein
MPIAGSADFGTASGVRPSSGAAIRDQQGAHDCFDAIWLAAIAAPEDGRTPDAVPNCPPAEQEGLLHFVYAYGNSLAGQNTNYDAANERKVQFEQ